MDPIRPAFIRVFFFVAAWMVVVGAGVCPAQTEAWKPAEWSRWNGWEIKSFTLTGAPPDLQKDLEQGLRSRGQWKLLRGVDRPPFSAKDLFDDLRRVRLFLAREGYPASQIRPEFATDNHARTLGLTLIVDPGPRVLVADVRYEGWPEGVDHPPVNDEHLIQPGQFFTDTAFDEMTAFLLVWLHDAGYAEVDVQARPHLLETGEVEVRVVIEPGDFYRIVEVVISGCSDDLVPVARRVMDLPPGSAFSATRIAEAASDLRATQLFSDVTIEPETMGSAELRLNLKLVNARMRSWRASVGTWADNPWMVRAGWSHQNLFKRSRGLDVSGTVATHEVRYGLSYFWLGWLSPRARSSYRVERVIEDEEAYRSNEYRAEFVQAFRPRNRALFNIGIGLSNVDVETYNPDETDIPESQDWLLEVWFDRKWDWTNDLMYPDRGGYVKTSLTVAPPGTWFEIPYVLAQVDGTGYVPLGSRFNLANRLRLGWSLPLGESTDLLANRRFYAGGYNTMRGYERRGLGPRDSSANPRGGQAVVLAGTELRVHLFGIVDAAVFGDVGQVWREPQEMHLGDLEVAVGADLGLRTPIGPVRVGHAWQLTEPLYDVPRQLWHFGIGYPW
jgi:outer membrane protein assembly factor BamA